VFLSFADETDIGINFYNFKAEQGSHHGFYCLIGENRKGEA
jgi:hypothetical protein